MHPWEKIKNWCAAALRIPRTTLKAFLYPDSNAVHYAIQTLPPCTPSTSSCGLTLLKTKESKHI